MKKYTNRKNIIIAVACLVIVGGISAYFFIKNNALSSEKFDSIEKGMSIAEVEDEIGSPKKQVESSSQIAEEVYSDYKNLNEMYEVLPSNELNERLEDLSEIYSLSKSDRNVKQYMYKVKNGNETREANIYFVDGAVRLVEKSMEN